MLVLAGCATAPVRQNAAPYERDGLRATYSEARAAWERGDLPRAWTLWLGALSARSTDPLAPSLQQLSAAGLETLAGELPGEREQEKQLAAVDERALPLEARRRLLALRGWYARRRGDETEARQLDRAAGALDRWFVAGPYGTLPRLGLQRALPPDEGGDVTALREVKARAGQVALEAPRMRAGVLYAVGWLRATRDQTATLVIGSDQPWRLFVDGRPLYDRVEEDHYPPRITTLDLALAAGWHRVTLKVAAPSGRADLDLSAFADPPLEPFSGAPADAPRLARAPTRAVPRALSDEKSPRGLFVRAEEARLLGDSDSAERAVAELLQREPKSAPARLLAGTIALEDPSRPASLAHDRARRAFARALALDPHLSRARLFLAELDIGADHPREALARLAPEKARSWRVPYLRWQALKARGWAREAEDALAEARKLDPEACAPLEAEVTQKRERHDVAAALSLAKLSRTCGGGSDDLADTLKDSGDLDGAIAEYERLLTLDPTREAWRAGLAETLLVTGRASAVDAFAQLLARYPRRTHYRRQLADALLAAGQPARAHAVLDEGLAETPESTELHRALEALCETAHCNPMDPFRVDGREVIAAYRRDRGKPIYQSPAVILLDRTVTRVFPTGARLTLTHNIIQVRTKDGIDKWGEVNVPEGADVLTLRTVKADGSTREPEEIAEKQAVSVPDLEPGDFVEFEYVDPSAAPAAFPDGFLAERFFFRSYDAPLDRTEYVLATPAGMPLDLDARGDAPAPTLEKRDGLELRTWSGRYKPQNFQEPAASPFAEFLPSVRASSGLSFVGWRDFLRDNAFGAERANEEVRQIAAAETRAKATLGEKVAALDGWVRRHIKNGGSLDEPASAIIAKEQGNRVTVLAALCRAAGIPSEVALVRPLSSPQLDGKLPDLEGYDQPVLLAGGLTVDPRYRHSAAGFVSPPLRGGSLFELSPGPMRTGRVPKASPDDRQMHLEVSLAPDGGAEVYARERLRGWPALQWRDALDKLAPDRVRPEFEQHTLGFYFPGSTLRELRWSGENDDDGLFTVEYRFHAPGLARKIGDRLVLPAFYPATLGKRYVGVATRSTPLFVDYAAPTSIEATVTLAPGLDVELPSAVKLDGFGRFVQEAKRTATGFVLDAFFSLAQARVPPDRYRDFVDFALRVDRTESRAAEIKAVLQRR
jgi:tetratricopeptide (TPR) repeat protein/transglutaminase-like putative cysteine protease